MTNIAIMAPAISKGYAPNNGYSSISSLMAPDISAGYLSNGGVTVKLASSTTENAPYVGGVGANGGTTSIKFASSTTENAPYSGALSNTLGRSPRPTTGQLWPRGNY